MDCRSFSETINTGGGVGKSKEKTEKILHAFNWKKRELYLSRGVTYTAYVSCGSYIDSFMLQEIANTGGILPAFSIDYVPKYGGRIFVADF